MPRGQFDSYSLVSLAILFVLLLIGFGFMIKGATWCDKTIIPISCLLFAVWRYFGTGSVQDAELSAALNRMAPQKIPLRYMSSGTGAIFGVPYRAAALPLPIIVLIIWAFLKLSPVC